MFGKIFTALSKIQKILSVIVHVFDVVKGILEAAKASGYQFPGRPVTA